MWMSSMKSYFENLQEEADDILDRTEHLLTELEENPDDITSILALQTWFAH